MILCPKCGKQNTDNSKFCRQCGTRLEVPAASEQEPLKENSSSIRSGSSKDKKKKWLYIGTGCGLAAAVALSVLFMNPGLFSKGPDYQETLAMAENYLFDLDYEKAEEFYLQAREIDPKQPEPYEQLYKIYTIRELPDKAAEIEDLADKNLEDADNQLLKYKIARITEDERPDPEREVVKELGKLDIAPISIDKKTWLLVKDGKYSFLSPDGSTQEAADGIDQISLWYANSSNFETVPSACLSSSKDSNANGSYLEGRYTPVRGCGGGGVYTNYPYVLADNDTVAFSENAKRFTSSADGQSYYAPSAPIVVSHQENALGDYYIFNPNNGSLHGPYKEHENAAYYKTIQNLSFLWEGDWKQKVGSPYWEKNDKSLHGSNKGVQNKFTLYSLDGLTRIDGFSDAMSIDSYSIAGFRSDRLYLFDQDLNELFSGLYQAAATPISGKVPVKKGGVWRLVSLEEKPNTGHFDPKTEEKSVTNEKEDPKSDRQAEEKPASEEPVSEASSEKTPEPEQSSVSFSDLSGTYYDTGGGRGQGLEMKLNPDGTFTVDAHDLNRGVTGPDHPNGEVIVSKLHGTFVSVPGQDNTIQITEVEYDVPVGTSEVKDEWLNTYSELPDFSVGTPLTVYPVGTPISAFPETTQTWFSNRGLNSDPIDQPYLEIQRHLLFRSNSE